MNRRILSGAALFAAALFLSLTSIFFFHPIRNVHPLIIILITLLIAGLIYYVWPYRREVRTWTKGKRWSLLPFFLLYAPITALSIRNEQEFLWDNHPAVIAAVYIGMILTIVLVSAAAIRFSLSFRSADTLKPVSPLVILLYMLPMLAASLFMFIAFYPGTMTPDSLQQWEQAKTHEFTDWHPVMYTWLIMVLTQIWNSPGIIALFQVLLMALLMGYMGYLMKRIGIHSAVIWGILILAAITPVNAIYSIAVWKDVVYSIFLVFFSLLLVQLVKTGGEAARKWPYLVLFFIASFGVAFFRHNGFPVYVVTMIAAIIMYRHQWKRLAPVALSIIILHQVITGPVFEALEIVDSDPQEMLSIPTQQIANIVTKNGEMTEEQREYVDRLMPLELWPEKYNPYSVDRIKFSWGDYDRWVIYNDWGLYFKMWSQLVMQNPGLAAEAMFKQNSLVWQINLPEDGRMSRFVTNIYYGNELGLENRVLHPYITQEAQQYLKVDTGIEETIWRPALYTFLTVLLMYIAYLRSNWRVWLILLPVALNTGAVFVAAPAQDFRYLFSNELFFFAALFISLIDFRKKEGIPDEQA